MGNIYLFTHVGTSPNNQRVNVIKISSTGKIKTSYVYGAEGEYAGSGALSVTNSSEVTVAFETFAGGNGGLSVVKLNPDGDIIGSVRRPGAKFGVSDLLPAADGNGYLITGVTAACGDGLSANYLSYVSEELRFPDDPCNETTPTYTREEIPTESGIVVVLNRDDLDITPVEPPRLEPFDVIMSTAECLTSELVENVAPLDTLLRLCPDEGVMLSAGSSTSGNYQWDDGTVAQNRRVNAPGIYTGTFADNCGERQVSFEVIAVEEEIPESTFERINLCFGDTLDYLVPSVSGEPVFLNGVPVSGEYTISSAGNYLFTREVACGMVTTEVGVSVQDCCDLYLPNAFSPNQDGVNDIYRPQFARLACDQISDASLLVYDKWGGLAFEGTGQTGWDGRNEKDRDATAGVYLAVFSYWNGIKRVTRSTSVTLIR